LFNQSYKAHCAWFKNAALELNFIMIQELNTEVNQLQSTIEETETTGQLYAVSPLAAAVTMATTAEGDSEPSKSPHHDESAVSEDGDPTG